MNSATFSQGLARFFDTPPPPQPFISWFLSQNTTTKSQLINLIGSDPRLSNTTKTSQFQALASIFDLDPPLFASVNQWVRELSQGRYSITNVGPSIFLYTFTWCPFAPRSRTWFQSQDVETQLMLVNQVCSFSGDSSGNQVGNSTWLQSVEVNTTMNYLQSSGGNGGSAVKLSYAVVERMQLCVSKLSVSEAPLTGSSLAWLQEVRANENQIKSVALEVCANHKLQSELNVIQNALLEVVPGFADTIGSCIATQNLNYIAVRMAYDLGSAQALQWFSIQSLSSQARTLATLCISSYQLSQIQADLNIYLQYLNATSRLTIRAKNTADDCLSSYTLITPKSAAESICSMKTVIWFASQQDPIKLQVADALCANAPKDIVGTYQNMSCINKYLGFSPRFRIVTCPAFAPINQRQITNVYIYMCLGAVSILFLLLVVWFIGNFESRKTRSTETKGSIWATPFNASLLISITCLIWQDALYSVYWGLSVMKMFPSESVINYYLGSQIFGVFWRLSYIFLCFKRSELQISRVFDQLWLQVIKGILVSTPVVQLTPVIANIVEIYYLDKSSFAGTYICQLISASSLLVLDCLFLYAFAKFLLEAKTGNLNQMELNFGIIARYGIVTCLFCFVISVSMMGKVVTIYVNPYNSSLLNIWSLSGSFAMHFVTACQIAMKIHVFLVKKSAGNPGSSGGTAGNGSLRDLMKSSNSAK